MWPLFIPLLDLSISSPSPQCAVTSLLPFLSRTLIRPPSLHILDIYHALSCQNPPVGHHISITPVLNAHLLCFSYTFLCDFFHADPYGQYGFQELINKSNTVCYNIDTE